MEKINKQDLISLYGGREIERLWRKSRFEPVINHPQYGWISPNEYRAKYAGKPCPFCGQKMVQGKDTYSTLSKEDAIKRGYEYEVDGEKRFNKVEIGPPEHNRYRYFHPHYISLDHKLNKARFPDKMFDSDNLQAMCWKCNNEKGNNNAYELEQTFDYIEDLANESLNRYPLL